MGYFFAKPQTLVREFCLHCVQHSVKVGLERFRQTEGVNPKFRCVAQLNWSEQTITIVCPELGKSATYALADLGIGPCPP